MYDVTEKSIAQLQKDMENGVVTSEELVLCYFKRIAKLDKSGPNINSVLELNPDAVFIARALDRERKEKGPRSMMHGIPVLLKDNISTCDKMHTTAGSKALANNHALDDSAVVKRLRESGAVILGKANLSEFARFLTMDVPDGFSGEGGQVKSPFGEVINPQGSSTGSAVAAAMSFAAATVGTETGGSIIAPSSANSVVGLKPTLGVVSRSGIVPICSQDTAGPIGRTVADIAALLGGMTGEDPEDPATMCTDKVVFKDYTKFLDKDALKGKRVGFCPAPNKDWITKAQEKQYAKALKYLEKAGAEVVTDVAMPNVQLSDSFLTDPVMTFEFRQYMDAYLAEYCSDPEIRTLGDIIRFNNEHAREAIPYGQDILEKAYRGTNGHLTEPDYILAKCKAIEEAGKGGIDRILKEKNLDVLVIPFATLDTAMCGYPILTVPAGIASDGNPIGLSFIGTAFDEPKLIACAYAFEQVAKLRKVPEVATEA